MVKEVKPLDSFLRWEELGNAFVYYKCLRGDVQSLGPPGSVAILESADISHAAAVIRFIIAFRQGHDLREIQFSHAPNVINDCPLVLGGKR